jgi:formate dehydrogenase major subunit
LLTGEHHDPDVNTPAYKETAVRIEVLPYPNEGSPLPPHNFRYGRRTPNEGVQVEVKWAQPNYVLPPRTQQDPETL